MKRKRVGLTVLVMCWCVAIFAAPPKEMPQLKDIFEKYQVDGSILVYDRNENLYMGYDLERCNTLFCPASTFKIPNSLIAFECGIISTSSWFKWDGVKRAYSSWEKDMQIDEAFKKSVVPVYQEIARSIGVERMRYYTQLFNYGKMDIQSDNIDVFWLEGHSGITAYQQLYFLQNLYALRLPVSERAMELTKELMLYETNDGYTLSGKTGWAVRKEVNLGWFVGFIETNNNVYFFATNIAPNERTDMKQFGNARIAITKDVLKELGVVDW